MKIGELWNILYRLVKNEQDRGKLYHFLKGIGNIENLQTTDKTSIVNSINEVVNNIGNLSNLSTTDRTSIVNAINELKTTLIEAINEVKTIIDDNEEITAKALCDLNDKISNL